MGSMDKSDGDGSRVSESWVGSQMPWSLGPALIKAAESEVTDSKLPFFPTITVFFNCNIQVVNCTSESLTLHRML